MKLSAKNPSVSAAALVLTALSVITSGCDNERRSAAASASAPPPPPVIVHSVTLEAKAMSKKEIAALGIKTESAYGGGALVSQFETVLEFVAPSNTRQVLQVGDIITTFGETPINTAVDLQRLLATMAPGTTARAIVRRGDAFVEVAIQTGRAHSKDEPSAGSLNYV